MLKNIFTGLLFGNVLFALGQSDHKSLKETITDKDITYPVDMERNYDQLLSDWSRDVKFSDNCRSNDDGGYYIQRLCLHAAVICFAYTDGVGF